jgi:histidinol-phosphatase (PHP family)
MKFDLHTHHDRCGHAIGDLSEYIEAAISEGMHMIGISDHSPYFAAVEDQLKPGIAMAKSEFPNYINEILRLKESYEHRIEVLLGVESDFFPEHRDLYQAIYSSYPFDYVIGSVHIMNGHSIFDRKRWEGMTEAELLVHKERYFDFIQQSARSGMFDILGHIDAIKKDCPLFPLIRTNEVEKTIKTISECDVVIEVNSSGKLFSCKDWFPSEEILQMAHYYGVKVTFGSDAHRPERVGDEWERVKLKLKEIGYKEWAVFRNRKREMLAL